MPAYVPKPDLETAKLFADETRMRLLEILGREEMTNSQLAKKLGLSKATITYHLKQLEKAGLITVSRTEYEKHGIPMKYYKLRVHLVSLPGEKETKRAYTVKEEFKEKLAELLKKDEAPLDNEVSRVLHQIMKSATAMPEEEIDGLLYSLGYELGREVMSQKIAGNELGDVLRELSNYWKRTNLGEIEIIRKNDTVVLRIVECFDCMSMPNIGKTLCFFDAGIFAGTLEKLLQKKYSVREVKCWGTGYEYCEFEIRAS
jgi:hypothetical protein